MNRYFQIVGFFGALLFCPTLAETVYSPVLGAWKTVVQPNSSKLLSMTLKRSAVEIQEVGSVAFQGEEYVLYCTEPFSAANAYSLEETSELYRYYVEFATGDAIGERIPVVGNDEDSIILAHAPTGSVAANYVDGEAGDIVKIYPYWTLGSVFGVSLESYAADDITSSFYGEAVYLLLPGTNIPAEHSAQRFVLLDDAGIPVWRSVGADGSIDAEDRANLPLPEAQVILRRSLSDDTSEYVLFGEASKIPQPLNLPAPTTGEIVEVPFALATSSPVSLDASELSLQLEAATSMADRQDELVFFAERSGALREADIFYYLDDGQNVGWRQVGSGQTDVGSVELEPGRGYLIRRRR